MKREAKAQLSKVTLYTLLSIGSFFVVGTIVLVFCAGLQINPFRERTTSFLVASFMGAIGLSIVALFLNVAANLGLIADSKANEQVDRSNPLKSWFVGIGTATVLALILVFAGTYLSERKFLRVVRSQADDVIRENSALIDKIGLKLKGHSSHEYWEIATMLKFLAGQRKDLPHITLIYVSSFQDKPARFGIESYNWEYESQSKEPKDYQPPYYQCAQDLDCNYLADFFNGKPSPVLEKFKRKGDSFFIFFPFEKQGQKFVLRFDRTQRYGKIGS